MGYCPQHDALIDDLSGRELLILFGYLRKIQQPHRNKVVDELLKKFGEHKLYMYKYLKPILSAFEIV